MKVYNRPTMQVENCNLSYLLMQNVSGGNINGIHEGPVDDPIEIF